MKSNPARWPVLRLYGQDHLGRIAMPLGGIGTGTVSLGGRGDLRDWEIMNRPAKGNPGPGAFFVLFAQAEGKDAVTRLLEGPLDADQYEGYRGCTAPNHGLPRFRRCTFSAAYPFGQVSLSDPDVPVRVRLQAFNPLVPTDADASGIPCAVLRYHFTNTTDQPVRLSVCGSITNDLASAAPDEVQHIGLRKSPEGTGLFLTLENGNPLAETWGSMALTVAAKNDISYRTGWPKLSWGDSLLDFWDDFGGNGRLDPRETKQDDLPKGSLAAALRLEPKACGTLTFLLSWHFPNRMTWTPAKTEQCACDSAPVPSEDWIGNYYAEQYADAWDVAQRTLPRLGALEQMTLAFVRAFCRSDLPAVVKEAALFNLSTLRSQTCFRTPDGNFYGWEGCCDGNGCCHGSCTHVWNYEQATAFLFGRLAQTMRDVEFRHATDERGLMSFRVNLPLERAQCFGKAAADGQMGCIMKVYRDWQLSGDGTWLAKLWPKVRKALEFCWIEGGWDADQDGVMEGCQHNTMDVEYYGPNPQMGTWYLGALRAAEEMARTLGDDAFADKCRRLFEKGSAWIDRNLFNGEYYEHHIRPPASSADIADCLTVGMGAKDLSAPDLQLGAGCLVDQLVGQYMAHVCGLGYLLSPDKVRATLQSIYTHNRRKSLHAHFNHLRTFALADEAALLMASYPRGRRPKRPFPYFNEVMTGFEYTAAVHMLYEGQIEEGLRCIRDIRDRYDGRKRSPFNEAECGHHYARAMASWAAVLALTGFHYSAVERTLTVGAAEGTFFWSTGHAWGTYSLSRAKSGLRFGVRIGGGKLAVGKVIVRECAEHTLKTVRTIGTAGQLALTVLGWNGAKISPKK